MPLNGLKKGGHSCEAAPFAGGKGEKKESRFIHSGGDPYKACAYSIRRGRKRALGPEDPRDLAKGKKGIHN